MTDRPMDRNDTRRHEVLSLARRRAAAGASIDAYRRDLGNEAVDAIIAELAPPKKTAKPKKAAVSTEPPKE